MAPGDNIDRDQSGNKWIFFRPQRARSRVGGPSETRCIQDLQLGEVVEDTRPRSRVLSFRCRLPAFNLLCKVLRAFATTNVMTVSRRCPINTKYIRDTY